MRTDSFTRDLAVSTVAALFEQHHRSVFAYLHRLVDDRDLAEDLARQTFLAALHQPGLPPGITERRAWLYRLATERALAALTPHRLRSLAQNRAAGHGRPDDAAYRDAHAQDVASRALHLLDPEQRAPLLLYSQCELKPAEIARVLGVTEEETRKRILAARTLFREAYERELVDERSRGH